MDTKYKDYKEILLKVLETIDYKNDKETFINQLINNIYLLSLVDLIESMSSNDQEKIKQEISASDNNTEKIDMFIEKYFTEEQRTKALELSAKNTMVNYISMIQNTLSPSQEENLTNLCQEFNIKTM